MAAGWLLCTSAATAATTHKVSVIDFRVFVPNDITIAVGDTVRWTNPVSRSGSPHDVTAEDGSWASPQAESFVFEHTFNTEGEFRYYCAYHDPNDNDGTHWGIVRVTAAPAATLKINAGLSDAWYAPATAGQGFFIIVWPQSGLLFLSWFTYDTERPPADVSAMVGDPGHRWLADRPGVVRRRHGRPGRVSLAGRNLRLRRAARRTAKPGWNDQHHLDRLQCGRPDL